MSELYKVKDFSELSEGEMVLAFGVHVLNWDFDAFGNPAYGIVPAMVDDADLRAEVEKLEAQAAVLAAGVCLINSKRPELFSGEVEAAALEIARSFAPFKLGG